MIVAGGTYLERCVAPRSEQLMGSGGRALLALPSTVGAVLHTFHPDEDDVRANFGASAVVHPVDGLVTFDYLHPLSRPRISPVPLPRGGTAPAGGPAVLRFGCLEGDFRVDADVAVYDPQNGGRSERFRGNGSRARRLAIVLNAIEAIGMAGGGTPVEAGSTLLESEGAEVVVVKDGPAGAVVLSREGRAEVPAYRTRSVFKIGSGDVFTAMFARHWALGGLTPREAADLASRQVAAYVEDRALPCPPPSRSLEPVTAARSFAAALIVDGGDLAAAWLGEEAIQALLAVGARSVAPVQGAPRPDASDVLLAIAREPRGRAMDASLEAARAGVPAVVFANRPDVGRAAAELGLPASEDFAGAVYAAAWRAR